jgi:phytoene desaturase
VRTVPGPTGRVVVVGAGLAGLSAALRLAGAGRQVTVLEREAVPGGRAGLEEVGGYRFDTGPTVLTMPELLDDALACVGETMAESVPLRRLDPAYRAFFPDGSTLDVHTDVEAMATEVEKVCGPAEAAGYRRFVDFTSRLYQLQMRNFIDRNIDSPLHLLTAELGPNLARLAALGGFRKLSTKVRQFLRDPRTQRVFSFQAMYAGLSPYEALALYAVIAYMDTVAGVWFPVGGMHTVPAAMAAAAARHGVDLHYRTEVTRVEILAGRARGVLTSSGERFPADAVVLTTDLPVAYRELLPPAVAPRRLDRLRYSPSCFLLLAGSRASYRQVSHHNIHFGRSWRRTFTELIEKGALMSDPSFLVTVPTRTDPSLAPPGRSSYYALFPTPNLDAPLDWDVIGPRYRDEVVARMELAGYVGFGDGIEVERITTPADWRRRGLERGAPFAAAHSLRQTGPFRPANLVRGMENVVLAGSGTVPGVGIPMVLVSGRLAAERITGGGATHR